MTSYYYMITPSVLDRFAAANAPSTRSYNLIYSPDLTTSMLDTISKTIEDFWSHQQAWGTPTPAHNPPGTGIPLDHTLSSDTLPNMPRRNSTFSGIPRNILAFRTITMLLSQLQAKQTLETRPINMSAEDRTEARISDAFAHLAVAEYDVVALVTKRYPEVLSILACVNLSSDKETPNTLSQSPNPEDSVSRSQAFKNRFFGLFSKNARSDDPSSFVPETLPAIVCPSKPENMGTKSIAQYLDDLESRW